MLNLFDYDFGVRLIKPDPNIYYRTFFVFVDKNHGIVERYGQKTVIIDWELTVYGEEIGSKGSAHFLPNRCRKTAGCSGYFL